MNKLQLTEKLVRLSLNQVREFVDEMSSAAPKVSVEQGLSLVAAYAAAHAGHLTTLARLGAQKDAKDAPDVDVGKIVGKIVVCCALLDGNRREELLRNLSALLSEASYPFSQSNGRSL